MNGVAVFDLSVGLVGLLLLSLETRRGRKAAVAVFVLLTGCLAVALAAGAGVLGALAVVAVMLGAAWGFGVSVVTTLDRARDHGAWQDVPLHIAIGLGVFIVLGTAAGVAGLLFGQTVAIICLIGLMLALRQIRNLRPGIRHEGLATSASPAVAWWWGLAVLLLIGLVGAVAPEALHDALTAHLPIARWFAAHHGIVEMRQNRYSYFQLNGDLLYAMGMVLAPGEAVPKLLHFAAGALAVLIVYDLGARVWHPRVGLLAAGIVAATPLVWWVAGTAYTDLWTVLFATGAASELAVFLRRPSAGPAALVGWLAGAAAGAKLTSLIVAVPIALAVVIRSGSSTGVRHRWRLIVAFLLGAVLTGAFWYIRTWMLTGNPVFPLLNAVFRSPYWPPTNTRVNQGFGMGTGLRDLLQVPWRVTRYPERFVEEGDIAYAYLLLLPVALWGILRGRIPRWIWGSLVAAGVLWFYGAQYLRHFLPALPLAALAGAAGLLGNGLPRWVRRPVGAILGLAFVLTAGRWITIGPPVFPLAVARGAISRSAYAAASVGGYRVAEFARLTLPTDARIYGAGEDKAYYYDRFFVPISWYGVLFYPRLPDEVLRARTGERIRLVLSRAGLTHVVVYRDYPMIARWRRPDGWLAREALWEEGPRLEYAYREYYLFALSSRPDGGRVRGPELLRNPGLAAGSAGTPEGWEGHGAIGLAPVEAGSTDIDRRAQLGRDASVAQQVSVAPEALYVLEAEARAMEPGAGARLFIQWLDGRGRVLDDATWRQVGVGSRLKRYAMACTAPVDARTALVWLIATDGGVEFSRPHFYELR